MQSKIMLRAVAGGLAVVCCSHIPVFAQLSPAGGGTSGLDPLGQSTSGIASPLKQPTLGSGTLMLLELDGRFSQAVAAGGGKAFVNWFADDAVTLNNGKPPVLGRAALAASAQWDPKTYQLTWVPQGAQMGPSNDMGFTWGHYEGRSKDKNDHSVVITGRYITVWKKQADGTWKVALDASADEPPASGECCALPKP
ncbi:MAG: nuclear transport factor 2 family protein [Acidobacteriota bacterium]|nr:nuclear transport factor 2 family protein [Acidobacteriota bacterium]